MSRTAGKTVLMLCYHYPPANNGGVERSVKFVKYLPLYGWKPLVVTTNKHGSAPTVGSEQVVYVRELRGRLYRRLFKRPCFKGPPRKTAASAPSVDGLVRKFQRAVVDWTEKWLLIPDSKTRWAVFAFWPSLRLLLRGEADAIFTTSPPASVHLLGLALRKLTGKAWLIDLRDPWTVEPQNTHLIRGGLRLSIEKHLERMCFTHADKVVLNTPEAAQRYETMYPNCASKMTTIPNGFDAEEMRQATLAADQPVPWREIQPKDFLISHVGAFSRNTDKDTTPYALLNALKDLLDHGGDEASSVRVIFAGDLSSDTAVHISELGLNDAVDTPGKISHFDAMRLIIRSDLLLAFDSSPQGETYVRGKIYEYVGAKKLILGILPAGASRTLLERYGRSLLVDPHDATGIRQMLERALLARKIPEANSGFDVQLYERKHLTEKLVTCLEAMSDEQKKRTRKFGV